MLGRIGLLLVLLAILLAVTLGMILPEEARPALARWCLSIGMSGVVVVAYSLVLELWRDYQEWKVEQEYNAQDRDA